MQKMKLAAEKPLPEAEKPVEEPEKPDREKPEGEEVTLSINTMKDFLDALYWSYDLVEETEKQEINLQILKIKMSLSSNGLNPEAIKVENTPKGVLGMYDPQGEDITISRELLEDFNASQSTIAHVLCHEKTHAQGYADEGITEMVANQRIPAAISFYVTEQERTKSTFHSLGTEKTKNLYDLKNPKKLIDEYLEIELTREFPKDRKERKKLARASYFAVELASASRHYGEKLDKVVDRLKDKLPVGYIKTKIRETWGELLKEK
ncbi:MAG: hypothetical protein MUC28_02315 [Planctomycetes bacterium]|jgi:hypothetical protein|nr:hypothetical protein [Planctomycetota bacterium]